ncbi:hypothetical protein NPIL_606621 [Nephila pilipes]|uniref:Uncharacterized protein n=1 Tax=Nephila pilipes TaxID=299642 RepID=A0A8X6TBE0_NEPPI|nr:hypothetical protein NPIL_606621 [Nephila pilipes]
MCLRRRITTGTKRASSGIFHLQSWQSRSAPVRYPVNVELKTQNCAVRKNDKSSLFSSWYTHTQHRCSGKNREPLGHYLRHPIIFLPAIRSSSAVLQDI